jgi:hypothetical protein
MISASLSVVARRERDDPPFALVSGKRRQAVEGAAELERTAALEVLRLEVQSAIRLPVEAG